MKRPSANLARRLLGASEQVLMADPAPRLEDVAELVGASRATLYYYFSGREDLLAFLLVAHAEHGADRLRAAVNADDPPEARLRSMVGALAAFLGDHPGTCAGLLAAAGSASRMGEVLQASDTLIAGPLRQLLDEGRRSGAFVVDDAFDAANAVVGSLLLTVLRRSLAGGDTTDASFQRQLTEQAVRGIVDR